MSILGLRTTKSQTRYWVDRKIDWNKEYFATWNHPHRFIITALLNTFDWYSLLEVGCGAGANLANILKHLKGKQLGGVDLNPDAIEECKKSFKGGMFKVSSADDLMMSDKSIDVILSDMVYIYVGPFQIGRYIKELRRLTRKQVVLCEFYEKNPLKRLIMYLKTGYFFHNWPKLLKKYGFYDITILKLPASAWPGGLQEKFCYIVKAKAPKKYIN